MAVFDGVIPAIVGAANAAAGGYEIERSLRFNDDDSAYLNRTPSSAGSQTTFTWACWAKLSSTGGIQNFLNAGDNSSIGRSIFRYASNQFQFIASAVGGTTSASINSDALFRDLGAWYHIVWSVDTTQATATDRVKLYVNGEEQTFSTYTAPSQNGTFSINHNSLHKISGAVYTGLQFFDGYLADCFLIDGQALAATDFGEYDDNNVWQPKRYSGSYGTNGFNLKFDDNSSEAALGTDSSGNNNTWTVNNITAPGSGIIYSNSLTTNTTISTGSLQSPFDGDTSTYVYGNHPSAGYFLFSDSISYTTSLEVYYPSGVPSATFELNGSTITIPTSNAWNTIATGSGTLTSLKVSRGGDSWFFSAIRVDGTILVDNNPADWDSLIDTPTNYTAESGNNGGNYATINPLQTQSYSSGSPVIGNGNLEIDTSGIGWSSAAGTVAVSSGAWYWEYTCSNLTGSELIRNGIFKQGGVLDGTGGDQFTSPDVYIYASNAQKWTGSAFTSYGATYTTDDVIGVALDLDAGTLTFYKNGSSQGSAYTGLSGTFSPYFAQSSDPKSLVNFGQRSFAYAPPSNHLALVTTNLSDPTIADGSTVFDVKTYTGTGSSFDLDYDFSPDFAWIKGRSYSSQHQLSDTIRSASSNRRIELPSVLVEDNGGPGFLSTGLNITTNAAINTSGQTYVSWAWDAGSSTESNTDGTITSNVRANPTSGFSIVQYTGNGTSGATVGHGLGSAPEFLIVRNYTQNEDTNTYHINFDVSSPANYYIRLNQNASRNTSSAFWNNTKPSSSVITLGNGSGTNSNTQTHIAYCFAPVEGYSAFGSYTGNGNADGPFVFTGFRPRFLLMRTIDSPSTEDWFIFDTERDTSNVSGAFLRPNVTDVENGSFDLIDILSNGFKYRYAGGGLNTSGETIIYAAFAEHPFKTARAR